MGYERHFKSDAQKEKLKTRKRQTIQAVILSEGEGLKNRKIKLKEKLTERDETRD